MQAVKFGKTHGLHLLKERSQDMKKKIQASFRKSPRLFVLVVVLAACCLVGAGTLVARQYYGNVKDDSGQVVYADTMAAGYNEAIANSFEYEAEKSVYKNNASAAFDSNAEFKLLEIVPYKGMGEIGYMVAGEEPINLTAFWKSLMAKIENEGNRYNAFTNISENPTDNITSDDVKNLYKFLGDGNSALRIDGTSGKLYNTQAFLKNVLADAYFGPTTEDLQAAIDFFAKVEGNQIKNRIDVLTVDPQTLNAHPELIEDATLIYIHSMGDASRSESGLLMKFYEEELYNPYVKNNKQVPNDEGIFYVDWISQQLGISHDEAVKKVPEYVNFEYRIGVDEDGNYVVKSNDLDVEVISKIYSRVMEQEVAIAIESDVFGIQGCTQYHVNKYECNESGKSQTKLQDIKDLYNNNMYKMLALITMASEDFYEQTGKDMLSSYTREEVFYHPVLNSDGTLSVPALAEDTGSPREVKCTNEGDLPENISKYKWNRKTWVADPSWLCVTSHKVFWSLGNLWKMDSNNDTYKKNRSDFSIAITTADSDYLFDTKENHDKRNVLILSKWDPTKRSFYKLANDTAPATPDFQTILRAILSRNKIRVLEVEPYDSFYYDTSTEAKKQQGLEYFMELFPWVNKRRISIDTMAIYEFTGNIEDLNSTYDVIYFGTRMSNLNNNLKETINASSLYAPVGTTVEKVPTYNYKNMRYSGNDLTEKKYNELLDFMKGGKVIIFDEGDGGSNNRPVYSNVASLTVDTKTFGEHSYLKKLAELKRQNEYKDKIFSQQVEGDTKNVAGNLYKKLEKPTCNLVITAKDDPEFYPVEYKGDPTDDSNKNTQGELKISFKIEGVPSNSTLYPAEAAGKYKAYLYMDANADGHYVGSKKSADVRGVSERIRGCRIYEKDGDIPVGTSASAELVAGKEYYIRKSIQNNPDYIGIIPWKLEVYNEANSSMRSCEINYTVVKCENEEQKKKIEVLQIWDVKNGKTGTNLDMTTHSMFRQKLAAVKEYKVKITSYKKISTEGTKKYKPSDSEMEYNVPQIGEKVSGVLKYSAKDWKRFFDEYDMLIFGFNDEQRAALDSNFNQALLWFIEDGKAVIFSHDMVIDYQLIQGNQMSKFVNSLRYLCGMDRYGLVLNKEGDINYGKLYDVYGNKLYTESDGKFYNGTTEVSRNKGIKNNCISYAGVFVQVGANNGDSPYGTISDNNNTLRNLGSGNKYTNAAKYVDRNGTGNTAIFGGNVSQKIRITNRGQITQYPYYIRPEISVAKTHTQYFELNLDEPNMAVWGCLAGSNTTYDYRKNDATNSYYILNKGNITYTGLGHASGITEEEVELFVNTMISAYRAIPKWPYANVTNEDATVSYNGDRRTYNINLIGEVDETATAEEFTGEKVRVYFNINTGDNITRADNSPVYAGVVDGEGNQEFGSDGSGSPKFYEIHKVGADKKSDGPALTSEEKASGSALIFDVDSEVIEAFRGRKVERHDDIEDDTPDYYVDVPMDQIKASGVKTLDIQVYLSYEDASGEIHQKLQHSFVNIVPSMLFKLE